MNAVVLISGHRKYEIYAEGENSFHFQNKLNCDGEAARFKLEMMTNIPVILASFCAIKKAVFCLPPLKFLIINSMQRTASENVIQ